MATIKGVDDRELERSWTLDQIRLAYYLAHKSEYRRMRAQARFIIEDLVKAFKPNS